MKIVTGDQKICALNDCVSYSTTNLSTWCSYFGSLCWINLWILYKDQSFSPVIITSLFLCSASHSNSYFGHALSILLSKFRPHFIQVTSWCRGALLSHDISSVLMGHHPIPQDVKAPGSLLVLSLVVIKAEVPQRYLVSSQLLYNCFRFELFACEARNFWMWSMAHKCVSLLPPSWEQWLPLFSVSFW